MGGEKRCAGPPVGDTQGSPPRRRGKVHYRITIRICHRITPAWAGKSAVAVYLFWKRQDHPRVGGEKSGPGMLIKAVRGSPPRGRGKDVHGVVVQIDVGITPAWAGKSASQAAPGYETWDHPRVGGEKWIQSKPKYKKPGSPPRGRGKGTDGKSGNAFNGITPAWAGKSLSTPPQLVMRRDHPRVGGEKPRRGSGLYLRLGSPPRGRGKARGHS